ncbi:MAG: hypothetical protein LBL37_07665, partial [Gracilibacteraceae bacterium]|nr:hypothetical protein [Gracilibacteraceae bacterium]
MLKKLTLLLLTCTLLITFSPPLFAMETVTVGSGTSAYTLSDVVSTETITVRFMGFPDTVTLYHVAEGCALTYGVRDFHDGVLNMGNYYSVGLSSDFVFDPDPILKRSV